MISANVDKTLKILLLCKHWRMPSYLGPHMAGQLLLSGKTNTRELAVFRTDSNCYSMVSQAMDRLTATGLIVGCRVPPSRITKWTLNATAPIGVSEMDAVRLTNLTVLSERYNLRHVNYMAIMILMSAASGPVHYRKLIELSNTLAGPKLCNYMFRSLCFEKTFPVLKSTGMGFYTLTVNGTQLADLLKTFVLSKEPMPLHLGA